MFGIEVITPDVYKNIFFMYLIILAIYRCGGVTFIFRLILRTARIGFKSGLLAKQDDEAFYIQMFRFLNGVNVRTKEDTEIISKGLSSGELNRSDFRFSCFFGAVGIMKPSYIDTYFVAAMTLAMLGFSLFMVTNLPKIDYVNYTYKSVKLQMSNENLFLPDKGQYINKDRCIEIVKTHPKDIYKMACEYLVLKSEERQNELKKYINKWNNIRWVYLTILFFSVISSVSLITGGLNSRNLNEFIFNKKISTSRMLIA
jgi:hypothetical protein